MCDKSEYDITYSGCRCCALVIYEDSIYQSICGDCQCLCGEIISPNKYKLLKPPKLHTVTEERKRLEKNNEKSRRDRLLTHEQLFGNTDSNSLNSKVLYQCHFATAKRLEYAVSYSHSIGDSLAHQYNGILSSSTVYNNIQMNKKDKIFILGSDSLWMRLGYENVLNFVSKYDDPKVL